MFFLKSSLDGPATQLLLELTAGATEADVIQLLRNRFGCANQQERFRAELRTRRRRPGETVQDLFLDIVRLLSLSYPGQSGELYQSIGRDCFLEALEDPELRIRVLDQQPTTMEQALAIVCRMQAYSNTTSGSASASKTEEADRRRVKTVVAVTSPPQTVATYIDERRIAQLERTIADQQREIRQLKSNEAVASHYNVGMQWTPPTGVQQQQQPIQQSNVGWYPYQASNGPSNWQQQPAMMEMPEQSFQATNEMNGPGKRYGNRKQQNRQPRVDRETCRLCLTKGHWQNSCPLRLRQHTEMSNNTHTDTARTHIDETQQKTVGTIDGDCPSETFMSIIVNGVVMHGLIDTGCDHSVCGSAVLPPDIELKPTDIKLAAANGTNIFVRGITCLNFTVNGTEMYVNVLVSDDLSDALIFGFDWLKRNKALWDFEAGTLMFENVTVQLKHRSSRANVRRIYVQESIIVQAHTEANVLVKLLRSSLRGPKCDWVTTPKEVKSGLFMARTLLPDEGLCAVRFMNISDVDQTIDKGLLLGVAMP